MGFFDKLSKKASETYQVTKEKATNLSEEIKLKGKVTELKEKIEKLYNEIGIIVYNEVKDGKDVSKEEVTAKCEEISKAKDDIEKIQDELLSLKNVRKCAKCGEQLDIEDSFCCKCGAEQPKQEKVEVKEEAPETETKPAEVIEKMVVGKLEKFFKEVVLVEQAFIKENKISIEKYVKDNKAEVASMVRFAVGEGIEKRQENFADEVMSQINAA